MTSARSILAVALVLAIPLGVVFVAGGAPAQAATIISGYPELDAYAPDNELVPGTQQGLTIQVDNDGTVQSGNPSERGQVTTARSANIELSAEDAPITIETNQQSIGSISEDAAEDVPINVTVPEDADPGTYEIEAEIDYSYTSRIAPEGGVETELSESTTETIEIEIKDEPRFRFETVDSDVQVGESGTLNVSVENVGSQRATAVDARLTPTGSLIDFGGDDQGTARIRSLAPGESEVAQYDVTVSPDAGAGGYSADGEVEYTDPDGVRSVDDRAALSAGIFPTPERDDFSVEMATDSVTAGETVPIEVTVTNNRNERVTDIEGKLFADDPLSSDDDEGFAGALDPGESTTMTFELSADSGATEKVFPVSMDFRYDDAEDDSRVSDTYRVPVQVTEPEESGGPPIALIGGAMLVVVLIGAGYWFLRGRNEA
ncbi:MAG: COG1361 S-layer family protein [Salinarchaeum sp.]